MRYMELAYTRHKLHQSHISTIHKYHEEEQGPTTDKNKREKKTTSILAILGRRPGTHPRSMKKKKKKQLQMNNQRARVE